jgi:NitT/TauT family transport system substrate-binding protein
MQRDDPEAGLGQIERVTFSVAIFCALAVLTVPLATAETIKVGVLRVAAQGPTFIAIERGYFAAEGLSAEPVFFDAGQPVAVAAVSGDVDFGMTGITAGLYSLGLQGGLRIIAGYLSDGPNFHTTAMLVSKAAYEGGFKTFQDLAGHSIATTQMGSTFHYQVGLLAEKFGFPVSSVRFIAMQSVPNAVTAVVGGQADSVLAQPSYALPAVERGDAKLIGWSGDVVKFQTGLVFTATKTANEQQAKVERFLRAYKRGVADYHDAFTGTDGARADQPSAPAVLAIVAKYLNQPEGLVTQGIAYIDRDARVDTLDVLHQIAWFKAQGMVKGTSDGAELIDKRYVVPITRP